MVLGLFIAFGLLAIIAAIAMVASRNPVHSALFLVGNLICLAAIFLLLGAEFLALIQVIVYAGAIMVLFLFVIMLLNLGRDEFGADRLRIQSRFAGILGLMLALQIALTVVGRVWTIKSEPELVKVQALSRELFTKYLFPFELASIILLIAMIGVVVLVKRRA